MVEKFKGQVNPLEVTKLMGAPKFVHIYNHDILLTE